MACLKKCFLFFLLTMLPLFPQITTAATNTTNFPAPKHYCLACHKGIEMIRPSDSLMMQRILEAGATLGDPNGCVVCHGGTPQETEKKEIAHQGAPTNGLLHFFTPVPGSLHVNDKTCGRCHEDHVYNVPRSMMNTDAGKIKAITWAWGIDTDNHDHVYGNHAIDDPDGPSPRVGTEIYKQYMAELQSKFPGQFPTHLKKIPQPTAEEITADPKNIAYNELRACNKCHVQNKGPSGRGHYRGMGCAACHMLYSNEAFYEGGDVSLDKNKQGQPIAHRMQGSRKTELEVNGKTVSGIQVSTCASCHTAGRRIGFAYRGLMAFGRTTDRGPFDKDGNPQESNGGYTYEYIRDDVHHRFSKDGKIIGGLLCQDCHTTNDMHGDGNIGATTLATVEIKCADCHGTPQQYPWELPLGFGDEFGRMLGAKERGLADKVLPITEQFSTVYPKEDGYLYSARGNPLGNVVKKGYQVILYSDSGQNFEVPLLKQLEIDKNWKNPLKSRPAMVGVAKHMTSLECYSCHSTWAAQYYGYMDVVDYRQPSTDWIDAAERSSPNGTTADMTANPPTVGGTTISYDYSRVRSEFPPLGINGKGRVSPLVGVIQIVGSVIGEDGTPLITNHIPETTNGISANELAPLNPHTTSTQARECVDCHGNKSSMGYGMDGGTYNEEANQDKFADAVTADGQLLSRHSRPQVRALSSANGDFSRILDKDGRQLLTVDSHWPLSGPLTVAQRDMLNRTDTCVACHKDMPIMPESSVAVAMLGTAAEVTGISFATGEAHAQLLAENNMLIAWVKVVGILALGALVVFGFFLMVRKKRK